MYYIATIGNDGIERASDFGFNMLERILLDECFKDNKKIPEGLIKEKRFCLYEDNLNINSREVAGQHAMELCSKYGIVLSHDNCFATVVDRKGLETILKRMRLKIHNLNDWQCSNVPKSYGLFDSLIIYDPVFMRKILSKKKYGNWDHANDRERAIDVLGRFIDFLNNSSDIESVVFYNEIFCSRWDSTGEMYFDVRGRAKGYKFLSEGKAYSYIYTPQIGVWHRL